MLLPRSSLFAAASLAALVLSASASAAPAPTYASIKDIVADNCLSCHAADVAYGDVVLDTEALVVANAAKAFDEVESAAMPLGNPEFKDSPEGISLLAYLKSVAKVK